MDPTNFRIGSLFSGIGGLELGLEMSGLGYTAWQVEQNEFCRNILARHWPGVERHEDVKEVGRENLSPVDVLCGGFPCQDISSAGKGEGLSGSRSGLWSEFARIVEELRPRWVVVENVASAASRWVDPVTNCLEQLGYEVLPIPISASAVGAPHKRARIFLVAYTEREQVRDFSEWVPRGREGELQREGQAESVHNGQAWVASDSCGEGLEEWKEQSARDQFAPSQRVGGGGTTADSNRGPQHAFSEHEQVGWTQKLGEDGWEWRPPVSPVCRVANGLSHRVERFRALGNAVVPQCAEVVGWVIRELEG